MKKERSINLPEGYTLPSGPRLLEFWAQGLAIADELAKASQRQKQAEPPQADAQEPTDRPRDDPEK